MTTRVTIREEEPADIANIRKVVSGAFPQLLEAELVDQLRTSGHSVISLVAVDKNEILGHIMFSRMVAMFKALGLAPVSVRPDRQGTGIGSELVREGLKRATDKGWEGVFVLGDPKYYQRFGFDPSLTHGFISPYSGAHFMLLPLNGYRPLPSEVKYAPAFAALG